jgi:hypothetical protein
MNQISFQHDLPETWASSLLQPYCNRARTEPNSTEK